MATSAFARIRAAFPDAHVVGALRPYLRTLLDGTSWFDALWDSPKAGSAAGLWRQASEVRRGRFDLAIVLPNSLESALVPFLAGVPRRAGYRQGRPGLLNVGLRAAAGRPWWSRRGPRRIPEPMPAYYDALLDRLELPPGPGRTQLTVTRAEQAECDAWFAARGVAPEQPVLAINAGASYGGSKLWDPMRFAAVARRFQEARGGRAVLLAGPAEVELVRAIARDAGALAAIDPVLPVGMTKPMVARAEALLTTDSGPRHIAVALGVPVVCLIGPTDRRYTDYALERQEVLRRDLDCSPCQRKECPLGHHRCMTEIEVDTVWAALERLLAAERRP